jgi:hypothetical protein
VVSRFLLDENSNPNLGISSLLALTWDDAKNGTTIYNMEFRVEDLNPLFMFTV